MVITIEISEGWSPVGFLKPITSRVQKGDHHWDLEGVITIETSKLWSPARFQKGDHHWDFKMAITSEIPKGNHLWDLERVLTRVQKGDHQWDSKRVIASEIPKGDHQWNTKRWPTRHQNVMITFFFYLLKSFVSLLFLCFCVSLIPQLLCEHDLYRDSKCSINKSLAILILILTIEASDDYNQFEVSPRTCTWFHQ